MLTPKNAQMNVNVLFLRCCAVGLHAKGLEEMALGRSRAALAFANKNQLMSVVFLSSQLSVADGLVSKEPFVIRTS